MRVALVVEVIGARDSSYGSVQPTGFEAGWQAVRDLAQETDLVLVVGSVNSSNSNRLRELAAKQGVPSYLIDGADDIRPEWLINVGHVGVTAGASAPESLVEGVIEQLRQQVSASVSEIEGVAEHMEFALPRELRIKTIN